MLQLRRGVVVAEEPLTVEVEGEQRRAWADPDLVGEVRSGDEVVVNTEALDLDLGSGGFDIVHVNLSRGLEASRGSEAHVMKLNYTSLQHSIEPIERSSDFPVAAFPVLVISLHGHLAPAAWAASQANPDLRIAYLQTAGGALPGGFSRDVKELRSRGLLASHVTVAPAHGGEAEAISTVGALDSGSQLGWDAAIVGPGPGILGSATNYGHGGMVALDSAHAGLALGLPTLLCPRVSLADPRPRHHGVSHHTLIVLRRLLGRVEVPLPAGETALQLELEAVVDGRHSVEQRTVDPNSYLASGLPRESMGRDLEEDPVFYAAPLAAGTVLAERTGG